MFKLWVELWFNRGWHLSLLAHLQGCSVHDLAIVFLTSKFSYIRYYFSNHTHKIKTEIASRWETTSSKPPGPIIMIEQSETATTSEIIFITPFCGRCYAFRCLSPAISNLLQKCWARIICAEPSRHVLSFLHPIWIGRVILITSGAALMGACVLFKVLYKVPYIWDFPHVNYLHISSQVVNVQLKVPVCVTTNLTAFQLLSIRLQW